MNSKKYSKKKILFFVLLLFILLISFFFLIRSLFPQKKVESFDLGGAISGGFNDLGNKIKGAGGSVGGGINDIKNQVRDIVNNELKNVLNKVKDVIVRPINALFYGITGIFVQIFNILKMIAYKITSLPSCMPFYLVDSIASSILGFIKYVVPGFIYDFFSNLYSWTLGIFVNWFLDLIGWTAADKKCYAFDINSEIYQMTLQTKNIGNSFASSFGKL